MPSLTDGHNTPAQFPVKSEGSQTQHGAANASSGTPTTTRAGTPATSTQPAGLTTPSTPPSTPSVHVPIPVPTAPVVPAAKRLVHTVTTPVRKVVKKLPVPKLPVPKLPGGLGLPSTGGL
jgi:hypothetical protein